MPLVAPTESQNEQLKRCLVATQTKQGTSVVDDIFSLITTLPEAEHFDAIGRLLKDVAHKHCLGIAVPEDYIEINFRYAKSEI